MERNETFEKLVATERVDSVGNGRIYCVTFLILFIVPTYLLFSFSYQLFLSISNVQVTLRESFLEEKAFSVWIFVYTQGRFNL